MLVCNCEHASHPILSSVEDILELREAMGTPWGEQDFYEVEEFPNIPKNGHVYLSVRAGLVKAEFVGSICDECAYGHMRDWVIQPY